MSGFTDILASIAVHAVIIGAVSVIRDEPSNLERRIEIPISFEIVEASYMPSSPASSSEEKEQIAPEPQDSEDEAHEPEEAEEVEPVEDETNVPVTEPDVDKSDIELPEALIESLPPPKASPMQDLVPDSMPPQMADDEQNESTPEPPSPLVEQSVETAQQQEERAEVVSVPSATGRIVPVYPRHARRKGHEGVVTVEISVGADGKVDDVSVAASSGHPELDDAAVAAVRTASFAPAMVGGVGVSGKLRLTFDFRLK